MSERCRYSKFPRLIAKSFSKNVQYAGLTSWGVSDKSRVNVLEDSMMSDSEEQVLEAEPDLKVVLRRGNGAGHQGNQTAAHALHCPPRHGEEELWPTRTSAWFWGSGVTGLKRYLSDSPYQQLYHHDLDDMTCNCEKWKYIFTNKNPG